MQRSNGWQSALRTKDPNEVSQFYEASLRRTNNSTHARLNTQRKVLAVLWTIWKKDVDYTPSLAKMVEAAAFLGPLLSIRDLLDHAFGWNQIPISGCGEDRAHRVEIVNYCCSVKGKNKVPIRDVIAT